METLFLVAPPLLRSHIFERMSHPFLIAQTIVSRTHRTASTSLERGASVRCVLVLIDVADLV
jgi:hypothetical protein